MSRIVLLDAQRDLAVSFSRPIVDALEVLGWPVLMAKQASELAMGDLLLVLGLENWTTVARPYLVHARQLGIRRILWNCEPLLPPDLPKSWLLDRFLDTAEPSSASRPPRTQRLFDRIAYYGFTVQSWKLPWNRDRNFPSRQFSYAAKESRRLLGFWREGLIDDVFVSLRPRQGFLASHGVSSAFVPVGYAPLWGRLLETAHEVPERDIDVLFLGHASRRRRPMLSQMEQTLAKAGYGFKVVDKDCYGEARTRLLNRTKVLLNLNSIPWEFPGMRMLMAMSCKAMVVSDTSPDTAPYVNGQHFLMAAGGDLADLVIGCLRDETLRSGITDRAYQFVTQEHTLAAVLVPALELVSHRPSVF
jgi:hypothetical protein